MRPRSPGPRRRDRLFAHALQRVRLEMLMRGQAEPVGPREGLFMAALHAGDRPDPEDFIVSAPLLMAEAVEMQLDAAPDADLLDPHLLDDDQTG